jgi:hypothetical protein
MTKSVKGTLVGSAIILLIAGIVHLARPGAIESLARRDAGDAPSIQSVTAERLPEFGSSTAAPVRGSPEDDSVSGRSAAQWQREFSDPRTVAAAFRYAVEADASIDFRALREAHTLVTMCKPVIEYVREQRSRQSWLDGQTPSPDSPGFHEAHYDRCAAVAKATESAEWQTRRVFGHEYWERLASRVDDPVFKSFEIASDADAYARADTGTRAEIRVRIAENLQQVLRSGDEAAWYDLGGRLLDSRVTADQATGYALILAACERGYDCTSANRHTWLLGDAARTKQESIAQRAPAATNGRAHSRQLELLALVAQGDWDGVGKFVPLDGTLFH